MDGCMVEGGLRGCERPTAPKVPMRAYEVSPDICATKIFNHHGGEWQGEAWSVVRWQDALSDVIRRRNNRNGGMV